MGMDDDDSSFFPRKHNYDANSKIMLAAIISLSLVVILVTLLHVYARCVLRRRQAAALRRRLGVITHLHTVEPPKTGLDPSIMAALPVFMFKQTINDMGSMECSVCLSILVDGEMARTLPNCKHTFHADCIDKWFGSNSTCPVCRAEAEPRLVAEPREGVAGAPPSAPPLEGPADGDGTQSSSSKVSGSSSRLSSFRWILNRERSSRRIPSQSCGQEEGLVPDLERQ